MSKCNRCGNDTHEDELKFNFGVCDGCDQNKEKLDKADGIQTEEAKRDEEDQKRFGPGWDPAPPPQEVWPGVKKHDRAFSTGWSVIKFNPDDDTCEGCGGQKTPEHPFYAPDGPENGNCAGETPECQGDNFVPWNSQNDSSEEAFEAALEERGLDGSTCLICQEGLEMNGLICMNCEDKYSWADGSQGEGFYAE